LPNRFAGQGSKKYEQPIKGNKKFDTFSNWEKSKLKIQNILLYFQM
jgi:choline monooxygenase